MLKVRFVRHGESAANAGTATSDPALIPLTEHGLAQARAVAESIDPPPTLIVMSPFERAQETAAPTIKKFPGAKVEVWPVQEFTYISPIKCVNTTAADRRPWVESYWRSAETSYSDGPEAESFSGLVQRVQSVLRKLHGMTGSVLVFGHGQFMQVVRWLILVAPERIDSDAMRSFRAFDLVNSIGNGESLSFTHDGQRWTYITQEPHPIEAVRSKLHET